MRNLFSSKKQERVPLPGNSTISTITTYIVLGPDHLVRENFYGKKKFLLPCTHFKSYLILGFEKISTYDCDLSSIYYFISLLYST